MSTEDDTHMARLYLSLGIVAGSLTEKNRMLALIQALRAGDIHADYVRVVRDKLAQALDEASQGLLPEQRGTQIVPVMPTAAMRAAGGHVNSEWLNDQAPIGAGRYTMPIDAIWLAMLAAAADEADKP